VVSVEVRGRDAGVQLNVGAQVVAVGHMLQIRQDLRLRHIARGDVHLLQQLFIPRIAVNKGLGVRQRAGVAVPVPGAAHAAGLVEDAHFQALLVAQLFQHVHAAKAGADDDCVQMFGVFHGESL